jgi:flagellar hook-associated protein 1
MLLGELSSFMDIRVTEQDRGQISIYTTSGVSLYDHKASTLQFDGHDMIGPQSPGARMRMSGRSAPFGL